MFPHNLSVPRAHSDATRGLPESSGSIFPKLRPEAVNYFSTPLDDYGIFRFETGATILT